MRKSGGGVGDEKKQVNPFEGGGDFAHHLPIEHGFGVVNARSVDEDDLAFGAGDDALDAIAGGLRLGSDDGNFLADVMIQQRGFAGVWTADDGDEAGTFG